MTHHHHHVHVEDDNSDGQNLTPEELGSLKSENNGIHPYESLLFLERKKQFELKRKQHYNEFRAARMADKNDDEPN